MSLVNFAQNNSIQIYYYIALFSTILYIVKLILFMFIGSDHEVFADFNSEIDIDPSFNFLSIQTVIAFFMGFGWMGYSGLNQFNFSQLRTFLISVVVGLIFMFGTALLMYSIRKLEKNVKKDKNCCVNRVGKAYTNFEPNSRGQVEIDFNDQLSVLDAVNISDEFIKSFDLVRVVKVEDDLLYIEKVKK